MRNIRRGRKPGFNFVKGSFVVALIALCLGFTTGFFGNAISYFAWQYPKNDSTPPPVYIATSSSPTMYVPVSFPPTPAPKTEAELEAMTEEDIEKVKKQFERKIIIPSVAENPMNPDSEWFDTGIVLRRDQKVWFGSPDKLDVKVDDPESRYGFIDNDFEENSVVYVDDDGNEQVSLEIETNSILGHRDYGTLKLRANFREEGTGTVKVIVDTDTYYTQIPIRETCSF